MKKSFLRTENEKILKENKEYRFYTKQSTELFSFNILQNQTLKDYSF